MSKTLAVMCLMALIAVPSPGIAQSTDPSPDRHREDTTQQDQRSGQTKNEQPAEPYLLRPGHYVYPGSYRPDYWSPHIRPIPDYSHLRYRFNGRRPHGRFRNKGFSRYERGFNRNYYDGYSGGYGYGSGYDVESAYNQGRYDADHEYLWYIAAARAGRLLNQYAEQFDLGVIQFRDGNYERALINLLGAAEKNHANAASRLHAGHALFALGRYSEATRLIARAFELSPSLPYKTYDIRDEYGNKADFEAQLSRLRSFVARHPNEIGSVTMLGYVTFYTDGPGRSHRYLKRARELSPTDMFIPKLFNIARLTESAGTLDDGQADQSPYGGRPPSASQRKAAPRSQRRPAVMPAKREPIPIRQVSIRGHHD